MCLRNLFNSHSFHIFLYRFLISNLSIIHLTILWQILWFQCLEIRSQPSSFFLQFLIPKEVTGYRSFLLAAWNYLAVIRYTCYSLELGKWEQTKQLMQFFKINCAFNSNMQTNANLVESVLKRNTYWIISISNQPWGEYNGTRNCSRNKKEEIFLARWVEFSLLNNFCVIKATSKGRCRQIIPATLRQ